MTMVQELIAPESVAAELITAIPNDAAATESPPALEALRRAFGVPFAHIDGGSGEVLRPTAEMPGGDWALWGEMSREVAARGHVELIDERGPLLVLAIPLGATSARGGMTNTVAVAAFLTRSVTSSQDIQNLAASLGAEVPQVAAWCHRQTVWTADALLRLAASAQHSLIVDARNVTLSSHVDKLSDNLASTYEEITLLFRLTENLRLSDGVSELGRRALEWLFEVVPAKGLAAEFSAETRLDEIPGQHASLPDFLTFGQFPLSHAEMDDLARRVCVAQSPQPIVINHHGGNQDQWLFPQVEQLILVPLISGGKSFGYLAAVNHVSDLEFGTVEARLLGSVATILAIHCGNTVLYREQAELFSGVVRALSSAINAKDQYTCGHSDRVARVAVRLAEEMGLAQDMRRTLYLAGLLHDIGKIGVKDEVLSKPGKLTPEEYEHIKQHPVLGYSILKGLKKIEPVLPAVLHHHESWNGKGYPDGLAGEEIPLIARILAVADAFDAMGSDRPYRKGMDDENLDKILHDGAGRQWDVEVIDAFFRAREDVREIAKHERETIKLDGKVWA
ncbi:MAG: HD domain-containing protein [Planctomycetia bacterium]|nr:HD domain-containing protein [Planctomycetia bacterium]